MRAIKVITVLAWVVIAAVVIGVAGWFISGTIFGLRPGWLDLNVPFNIGIGGIESLSGPFNVVGETSLDTAGIDSINVDWVSGEITVVVHTGNEIEITERAQRSLHDDERMHVTIVGSTLNIGFVDSSIRGRIGRMPQKRLEILVPTQLASQLQSLNISATSSVISVDGFTADAVDIGSTSGALNIENINANTFTASALSGRVTITNINADNLALSSTSGSITAGTIQSGTFEVNALSGPVNITRASAHMLDIGATSGTVRAEGAFEDADIRTLSGQININNSYTSSSFKASSTSGAIRVEGAFYSVDISSLSGAQTIESIIVPTTLSVSATSGRVQLTIPNDGSVTVSQSSTSGRFNSEIPIITQSSGAQFTFSTLSGNVDIFAR